MYNLDNSIMLSTSKFNMHNEYNMHNVCRQNIIYIMNIISIKNYWRNTRTLESSSQDQRRGAFWRLIRHLRLYWNSVEPELQAPGQARLQACDDATIPPAVLDPF